MKRGPAAVLLAVSCVLASVSVVALWIDVKVLDQTGYVDAVESLSDHRSTADAASELITRRLLNEVPATVIARQYAQAQGRPTPANPTAAARALVGRTVETIVAAGQFDPEWREAIEASYPMARQAVVGGVPTLDGTAADGRILVDLSRTLAVARARLVQLGVTAYQRVPAASGAVLLELADLTALRDARSALNTLVVARWALPAATIVLLLIGLAGSEQRLRALAWWGAGVALTLSLTLLGMWAARHFLIDGSLDASVRQVQAATFDALTASLRTALAVGVAVSAMLLVAATEVARGNEDDSHRI